MGYRIGILLLMWLVIYTANANEWRDDFANAEASQAHWVGDWGSFAINKQGQLQSQASQAGEHALLRSSHAAIDAEWGCWLRISGTCSAYNLVRFYLTLASEDTRSDGYFVQIGGTNKNITLYEQQDGLATKVIEHSERKKILDMDASYLYVKVTRESDGMFRLYSLVEGKDSIWIEEGSIFVPMVESKYSAIEVKNTKTRGYDFYVDDVYVRGERQQASLAGDADEEMTGKAHLHIVSENISPNGDGWEDEVCVQYEVPNDDYKATIQVYTANGILVKQLCKKEAISLTGEFCWDGTTANGSTADIGVYVLYVELQNSKTHDTLRHRAAVALTL